MAIKRVTCPYCAKKVALTKGGKLYRHNDPATRRKCSRSGGRPN
jgi:ribosomal protein S27E